MTDVTKEWLLEQGFEKDTYSNKYICELEELDYYVICVDLDRDNLFIEGCPCCHHASSDFSEDIKILTKQNIINLMKIRKLSLLLNIRSK